jgi:hypothetical protein
MVRYGSKDAVAVAESILHQIVCLEMYKLWEMSYAYKILVRKSQREQTIWES